MTDKEQEHNAAINTINSIIQTLGISETESVSEQVANLKKERDALAAFSAALKSKGHELLGEACAVYAKLNKLIDPEIGDFIDGQTLHEFQSVLDEQPPATERFIADMKAQGVDELAELFFTLAREEFNRSIAESWRESARFAKDHAAQLRKGVQS